MQMQKIQGKFTILAKLFKKEGHLVILILQIFAVTEEDFHTRINAETYYFDFVLKFCTNHQIDVTCTPPLSLKSIVFGDGVYNENCQENIT
jgi:hypothetical protein